MKKNLMNLKKTSIVSIIWILILLISLTTGTYAWFTANSKVTTSRVSARTGEETLELYLSAEGGDSFNGKKEVPMVQVNTQELTSLMPVSTSDLSTFVYCTQNDATTGVASFSVLNSENCYYHGRFYMKAEAKGFSSDATVSLYLDGENSGKGWENIFTSTDSNLQNAARVGLAIQGQSPVILSLSSAANSQTTSASSTSKQANNTILNGQTVAAGNVLTVQNGEIVAVKDPSVPAQSYSIIETDTSVSRPDQPLVTLKVNQEYQVDVYFYLEGCDPDCSDYIHYDDGDFQLAFYGILNE